MEDLKYLYIFKVCWNWNSRCMEKDLNLADREVEEDFFKYNFKYNLGLRHLSYLGAFKNLTKEEPKSWYTWKT